MAADNTARWVSIANHCMRAWEQGNEEEYRGLLADDARMVIAAYGLDVTGFDSVWGVRKSLGDGPLAIHAQHSAYVTGRTVVALGTVYSRTDGHMQQHVEVRYTFNEDDRVVLYEQNILWRE